MLTRGNSKVYIRVHAWSRVVLCGAYEYLRILTYLEGVVVLPEGVEGGEPTVGVYGVGRIEWARVVWKEGRKGRKGNAGLLLTE